MPVHQLRDGLRGGSVGCVVGVLGAVRARQPLPLALHPRAAVGRRASVRPLRRDGRLQQRALSAGLRPVLLERLGCLLRDLRRRLPAALPLHPQPVPLRRTTLRTRHRDRALQGPPSLPLLALPHSPPLNWPAFQGAHESPSYAPSFNPQPTPFKPAPFNQRLIQNQRFASPPVSSRPAPPIPSQPSFTPSRPSLPPAFSRTKGPIISYG